MLAVLLLLSIAFAQELGLREAVARASGAPAAELPRAEAAAAEARARGLAAPAEDPAIHVEQEPGLRRASLELPLDLALPARLSASADAREAAALDARIARVGPGLDAAALWLEARAAQDRAEATAWLAERAARGADAARARLDRGELAPDEAALLLAEAVGAGSRARDAEAAARDAARRLLVALGEAPGTPLTLAGWEAVPEPPAPAPGLARLEAERAASASASAARLARAERLPALSVSGGWQLGAAEEGAVLGVSLGLPLWGAGAARAADAEAQAARAGAALASLQDDATQAAARQELALAGQAAEAWRSLDLRAALDAASLRYARGEIGPGEALARQGLLADALLSQIDARLRLERARLALWALAGRLPWEDAP